MQTWCTPVKNFQRKEKTELSEFHDDLRPAVAKLLSTAGCSVDMAKLFHARTDRSARQLERACLVCNSRLVVELPIVADEPTVPVVCSECKTEQQIWYGELPSTSHRNDFSRTTPTPAATAGVAKFLTSLRTVPQPDEVC